MKGNPEVIAALNKLLASELAAVNQYSAHAGMLRNWGYERLAAYVEDRRDDEAKHRDRLIDRILFLEGAPLVAQVADIFVGSQVPQQFIFDSAAEQQAIADYNAAVMLACEQGDHGTDVILRSILAEEEDHLNELESFTQQIAQMGLPQFLAQQIKK